ncbi:MAG: 2OG-Fe(II) oxygenase [Myxococcota bacterium]
MKIQIVHDLLSGPELAVARRFARARRGGPAVRGKQQDTPFGRRVLGAAHERFPELTGLLTQQVLLRFEGNTGLLHHDRNHREDRRFSLLFYLEAPQKGGEVVFPFFDPWGDPVWNPVTEACEGLHQQGTFFAKDPALESWMVDHREQLFTVQPRPNTAVLFACHKPELWHFVCPVEDGQRACVVAFFISRT